MFNDEASRVLCVLVLHLICTPHVFLYQYRYSGSVCKEV